MKNTLSYAEAKAMPFGIKQVGVHIHLKLRFKKDLLDLMLQDRSLLPYVDRLRVICNREKTHSIIAGIFHYDTHIAFHVYEAMHRAQIKLTNQSKQIGISFDSADPNPFS